MTLEELIEQTEKVAIYHDKDKMPEDTWHYTNELMKERYYQLTACLKELKAHREAWGKAKRTVKAYLMLEGFGSAYQDDIENLIEGCIPKDGGAE